MIKNNLFELLIKKQLNTIASDKKFTQKDIKRLLKYINGDIFDDNCCLWSGYVTENKVSNYINFYLHGKKTSLHRLLYVNFVDELLDDEYIRFTCENKGKCCSINHMVKCKYNILPHFLTKKTDDKNNMNNLDLNLNLNLQ